MDVKSIIKQRGYTIEQVAERMGVTRVTLTQNLSRNPTINTLQRIAEAIGCKVGDFFLDEFESKDENTRRKRNNIVLTNFKTRKT